MSFPSINVNVVDLCRLCLGKDESLIPVFDSLQSNKTLCDKINVCLAIQISADDKISQQICARCLTKVDSFYEFRNTTSESQRLLEQWLQDSEAVLNDMNLKEPDINDKGLTYENSAQGSSIEDGSASESETSCEEGSSSEEESENCSQEQEYGGAVEMEGQGQDVNIMPIIEAPGPSGLQPPQNQQLLELLENNPTNTKIKKVRRKTLHACEFCGESFTKFKLDVHRRKHTGERPYKCPEVGCGWAFASKGMLTSHGKVHTQDRPHNCPYCSSSFKTPLHLTNHIKTHTGEKSYYCDLCDYSTIYKATLLIHRKRHLKQYSVICEVCGKGFYNRTDLKEHMSTHTGDTPFSCHLCNDKYANKYQLRKHKVMHHHLQESFSPSPIQCEKCPRICPDKRSFRSHMRRVHDGKQYECEVCGKCVRNRAYLVEHLRIHSGEKPYLCKLCGKSFAGRKTIRMHEVVHTGERRYECDECGKRFTQKSSLNAHKKLHNTPF